MRVRVPVPLFALALVGCEAMLSLGSYREDSGVAEDTRVDPVDTNPCEPAPPAVTSWTSPNGGRWAVGDDGTRISGFTGTEAHPNIVPSPQLCTPSDDYLVTARVKAPIRAEFGVLIRVQPDGSAVLLHNSFGGSSEAILSTINPSNWAPFIISKRVAIPFTAGHHYMFKVEARGGIASGKIWDELDAEPADWQVAAPVPYKTGRGTGFYNFGPAPCCRDSSVLESLTVTPL